MKKERRYFCCGGYLSITYHLPPVVIGTEVFMLKDPHKHWTEYRTKQKNDLQGLIKWGVLEIYSFETNLTMNKSHG